MTGRTALVAGGAGFIGSHLVDSLLRDGYRVIVIDNLATGARANLAAPEGRGIMIVEQSIREPVAIAEPIHEIYNLASPASPKHYQKDLVDTLLTNVVGAQHLLDLALEKGAAFFQASTSEVYGDPAVHPQPESYWGNVNPTGIRACYDEGKRAAEALCFDYARSRAARVRVGRIFNTYGPRMAKDDGRVVSNFIVQALAGEDITVYGSGDQTRSFQYVDDLVVGIRTVMGQEDSGPFNLGNPDEYAVRELAEKVIALTGSASKIVRVPLPADDPTRRKPDISRARALGWEPRVPLEAGLRKTIEYFRSIS